MSGHANSTGRAFGPGGATRRAIQWGAWLLIVAAIVHPAAGLGVPICPSRLLTNVPCPGCGLTRSVSRAIRADLSGSWNVHPFGAPFLAVVLVVAAISLLPRSVVDRCWEWVCRHRRAIGGVALVWWLLLLVYGGARMAGVVGGGV